MKLFLDNIIFSLQASGGISVMWYELVKRILEDPDIASFFLDQKNENLFRSQLIIPQDQVLKDPLAKYPPRIQAQLCPKRLPENGIFHSSYYRVVNDPKIFNITTVHDFTYEHFRNGIFKIIHSKQKARAIKSAHKIICVSENTKKDLLSFFPEIDESRISVVYNGVDDNYYYITNRDIKQIENIVPFSTGEYALFVGDRKSLHKNFNICVQACKETQTPLVMVGGGPITKKEEKLLLDKLGKRKYLHLGGIVNKQLNFIYNHALCLLYPSAYEGFGIPIIEAQKAGCAVVCYHKSSIPEVAGKAAFFLEEVSAGHLSEIIRNIKGSSELTKNIIKRGLLNAERFSWDICYQMTKDIYTNILSL